MTSLFDPRALAARLYDLHREKGNAPTSSFAGPSDLKQAMDAQNFLSADEGINNKAWKVTMTPDGQPVTAPLFPYIETGAGGELTWHQGTRFEAEIAVRLGKDLPPRHNQDYTRADVIEAVASVHLGAELLNSRVEEGGAVSFLLFLADRLGNSGYVLGPSLTKTILDTVGDHSLKVTLAGSSIYDGLARHPKGDVLFWLLSYANDPNRPAQSLSAGSMITTGTLCGAIEIASPGLIDITLGEGRKLAFSLKAA